MGYRALQDPRKSDLDITEIPYRNFWAGWFPYQPHNDIPGKADGSTILGSPDLENTAYFQGRLRKMFGYTVITDPALNGGTTTTSLFYSPVLSNLLGSVGNKLYSTCTSATPTDITGALAITAGNNIKWNEWQFSTTKLVIGNNGVDAPWKWSGSGDAVLLGGSPPTGKVAITWQDCYWIGNTATDPSRLYFSNIGDPEIYTANDDYNFDAPLRALAILGDQLFVFMDDHIGVLSGENNRKLTKINRYIDGVGISGQHTIVRSKFRGQDVLIFHAFDGIYMVDGSRAAIKLSTSINPKYYHSTTANRWKTSLFSNAVATYFPSFNWYVLALADGSDTGNLSFLVLDLSRPFVFKDGEFSNVNVNARYFSDYEGLIVPAWHTRLTKQVTSLAVNNTAQVSEAMFFGSNDGKFYRFDPATLNFNGSAYTSYWKSKVFDLGEQALVTEVNVLNDQTTSSLTVSVQTDLQLGDGSEDTETFPAGGAQLGIDFVLDTSALGGKEYVYKNFDNTGYGRFMQFKFENGNLNEDMNIQGMNIVYTTYGLDPNEGN